MVWLLSDNSNSRTKFALGDSSGLREWRRVIATADISAVALTDLTEPLGFSAVVVCSVVPMKAAVLREFFEGKLPIHFVSAESPIGMRVDHPEPSGIGADRLANAAGVLAGHGAPAIIADFGTAVTFDVVSEEPAYLGGVIAPGLGVVAGYLPEKTAQLPAIDLEEPDSAIGKSTLAAMQAGAVFGYHGLVREILARIGAEMSGSPVVVATGGDAAAIARGLPEIDRVDADVTLNGLREIARRVFGRV